MVRARLGRSGPAAGRWARARAMDANEMEPWMRDERRQAWPELGLLEGDYPTGAKIADSQTHELKLRPHPIRPMRNHTLSPVQENANLFLD